MPRKPNQIDPLTRKQRVELASARPLNAVELQIQHLTQRAKAYIEGEVSDTDAGRQVFNKVLKESLSELENPQQRFELLEELKKQSEQKANSFAPFKDGIVAEHKVITEERTKAATKIQSIARVKPAKKKLGVLKNEGKQAQAKKEAEDRIRGLNSLKLKAIISVPATYTEYSNQYKELKKVTEEGSPKMDALLKIEDKVGSIVRAETATRDDKRFLKEQIQQLVSQEDKELVDKHMGSLLRSELKKQGIKVERTWGQFFSDTFRNNDKAHEQLKKSGFDVESLVTSMQNHAKPKTQSEQKPPAQRPRSEGRGV